MSKCRKQYYLDNREKILKNSRDRYHANPKLRMKRTLEITPPEVFLLRRAKQRANKSGIGFDIDLSDIFIPEICPILGILLVFPDGEGKGGPKPNSPSLDRVDNSKGYIKGNVRVISTAANTLKNSNTPDTLKAIISYIENHFTT